MNQRLNAAAQAGGIDMRYTLIQEDPHVMEHFDGIPFVQTPLHIAAAAGHISFVTEIMRLKPSFAWKLNQQGLSPMHLALQNNRMFIAGRFASINKDLVRVKAREGITPLHLVTKSGQIYLLTAFLSICPDSIEDVTVRGETALHLAVKARQFEALKVLVGWLKRTCHEHVECQEISILDWKDEARNTILSLAARQNDPQVVKFLRGCKIVLNAKNGEGLTALDIVETLRTQVDNAATGVTLLNAKALRASSLPGRSSLADELRSKFTLTKKLITFIARIKCNISDETRNALLVVAVLIARTTYQAALSPPGGFHQADNKTSSASSNSSDSSSANNLTQEHEGRTVMTNGAFLWFWIHNIVALMVSVLLISILLPVEIISFLIVTPLQLFTMCYMFSMTVISPISGGSYVKYFTIFLVVGVLPLRTTPMRGKLRACVKKRTTQSCFSGINRW